MWSNEGWSWPQTLWCKGSSFWKAWYICWKDWSGGEGMCRDEDKRIIWLDVRSLVDLWRVVDLDKETDLPFKVTKIRHDNIWTQFVELMFTLSLSYIYHTLYPLSLMDVWTLHLGYIVLFCNNGLHIFSILSFLYFHFKVNAGSYIIASCRTLVIFSSIHTICLFHLTVPAVIIFSIWF